MIPGNFVPQPLTPRDAQDLLTLVQSAPLANLHQARVVDQLCLRAQVHFAKFFGEQKADAPADAPAPEAGGKKSRKAGNGAGAEAATDPLK